MNDPQSPAGVPLEAVPPAQEGLAGETVPVSSPVMAVAVECPGCGAKLRNVSAEPGAKIRCLNCGTRFVAIPATATTAADGTASAAPTIVQVEAEDKPTAREPRSAGYWILRVPAMILLVLACVGYAAAMVAWIIEVPYRGHLRNFEDILPPLYFPLLPLAGFYFFVVTRSLARAEAATLKTAWKSGLVRESLPMVRGGSLPYIAPLACGPTVLFLMAMVMQLNDTRGRVRGPDLAAMAFLSLGSFGLAFMCEDLRQFLWRQRILGEWCAQGVNSKAYRPATPDPPTLGCLMGGTLLGFAVMALFLILDNVTRTYRYSGFSRQRLHEEVMLQSLVVATLLAITVTAFLLGRNFVHAIGAWWNAAASVPGRGGPVLLSRGNVDGAAAGMRIVVYAFVAIGWIFMLYQTSRRGGYRSGFDLAAMFCGTGGGTIFILTLVRIYASVRSWRKAQMHFWLGRGQLAGGEQMNSSLPPSYSLVVGGTFFLAAIEALFFLIATMRQPWMRGEEYIGLMLACFMIHFPVVWVALLAREFILAEQTAMWLRDTPMPVENPSKPLPGPAPGVPEASQSESLQSPGTA